MQKLETMASFGAKAVAESSHSMQPRRYLSVKLWRAKSINEDNGDASVCGGAEMGRMGVFFVFFGIFQEVWAITSQPKHLNSRKCLLSAQKVEYWWAKKRGRPWCQAAISGWKLLLFLKHSTTFLSVRFRSVVNQKMVIKDNSEKKLCSGKLRKNSLVVPAGAQIQTCLDDFMTSVQIFALRVLWLFLSAVATTRPPELRLDVSLEDTYAIFPLLAANVVIQTHTCCSASAFSCSNSDWRNLAATIETNKHTKKLQLWKDEAHEMMMRSYNQTIHERLNNHLQDRTE